MRRRCPDARSALFGQPRSLATSRPPHHVPRNAPLIRFIAVHQPEAAQALQRTDYTVLRHAAERGQFFVPDVSSFSPKQPIESRVVIVLFLF